MGQMPSAVGRELSARTYGVLALGKSLCSFSIVSTVSTILSRRAGCVKCAAIHNLLLCPRNCPELWELCQLQTGNWKLARSAWGLVLLISAPRAELLAVSCELSAVCCQP